MQILAANQTMDTSVEQIDSMLPCVWSVIDHFTVVCSVTWPLHGSEAGGDLALIQTSRHLSCKCT